MKWYAVQGRTPGDDEDSTLIFQADDSGHATEQFADAMRNGATNEEIEDIDARMGSESGVYITSILESDTEIRSVG